MQLLIFAGFPKCGLNAGGLQHCVAQVEELGLLEHDPAIQYRKEGVFVPGEHEELLYPVEHRMSDLCLRDGITWAWFPPNWAFGNGVTCHKTTADYEMKTVVHGTEDSLDEYLRHVGPSRLGDLVLEQKHIRTEGWAEYERRWLPGTCPQENHIVHLTWLVTKHGLPPFAYEAIRQLIEAPSQPVNASDYEPRHFSEVRKWNKNAAGGVNRP